jgi:16S rRNA (guanine527-N7)-methyltransferase
MEMSFKTELSPQSLLESGLQQMSLEVSETVQQKLLQYVALLGKWNRAYNLTSVHNPGQMIVRHILDSLVVLPYVRGPHILDVGSGAGLPGIPLALMHPEWQFVLLDSNGKKTRFITQAVAELQLENVEVAHSRAEDYKPKQLHSTVVSRAFTSLENMVRMVGRHCAAEGCLLAMKGTYPMAELDQIPEGYSVSGVHPLVVPHLDADRHVVVIEPTS